MLESEHGKRRQTPWSELGLAPLAANGLILRNPTLINFLDGCALSLPCHAPGEAPVGLMVAGPAHTDARILDVGLALEQVLGAR